MTPSMRSDRILSGILKGTLAVSLAVALPAALATVVTAARGQSNQQLGEQVYARCAACHALAYDRVGPRHCGLLGRRAGSVPGFAYSSAMKASDLSWDEKTLDLFLTQPTKVVPGTTMTYDGIADPSERASLIAYLKHANDSPECRRVVPARP